MCITYKNILHAYNKAQNKTENVHNTFEMGERVFKSIQSAMVWMFHWYETEDVVTWKPSICLSVPPSKGEVPAYSSKLKFAVLNSLSFNACHGQQGHIFWHSGTFSGMHILKTAVSTAILAAATLEHCGSTYEKQLPGREALLTKPHCDEVWNSSVFSLRGSQDILFFFWTSILEMAITIYTQRPTFFRKHHLQQF